MYHIGNVVGTTPGSPPKKKRKIVKEKRSKAEKALEGAMESFVKHQTEAEERYQKREEERWKKETELDDKRRKEDQEHELRLFQMLERMMNPANRYSSSSYDHNYTY